MFMAPMGDTAAFARQEMTMSVALFFLYGDKHDFMVKNRCLKFKRPIAMEIV